MRQDAATAVSAGAAGARFFACEFHSQDEEARKILIFIRNFRDAQLLSRPSDVPSECCGTALFIFPKNSFRGG